MQDTICVWRDLLACSDVSQVGVTVPIPSLTVADLCSVCTQACEIVRKWPSVVDIPTQCYVVGDLHGNLHDLLRLFKAAKFSGEDDEVFLFLGDYVDRGEYSIEVVMLLFSLLVRYPKRFVLLRGNHEFRSVNANYGFGAEVAWTYKEDAKVVYDAINEVFDHLPFAAIIKEQVFCCHGGLSPKITKVQQIRDIERPVEVFSGIISDLTWSDPVEGALWGESVRGMGYMFNSQMSEKFLSENKLTSILRSHQCVADGLKEFHKQQVYTIFSSSNYAQDNNGRGNTGGILQVLGAGQVVVSLYDPPVKEWVKRGNAKFRVARDCSLAQNLLTFKQPINQGLTKCFVARMALTTKRKCQVPGRIPSAPSNTCLRGTVASVPRPVLRPKIQDTVKSPPKGIQSWASARSMKQTLLEEEMHSRENMFGDFCLVPVFRKQSE